MNGWPGRQLGILAALAVAAVGCGGSGPEPYSVVSTSPISVTLTYEKPVAVFDVAPDRSALPLPASVSGQVLELHGVDPRVQASAAAPAGAAGAHELERIYRPTETGDLTVGGVSPSGSRFALELTGAVPGDSVTVAGVVREQDHWPGTAPRSSARVSFSGLDSPELRAAASAATSTAPGPRITLDADHSVALVPMTLSIAQGGDTGWLASDTRIGLADGVPPGAAVPSVYSVVSSAPTLRQAGAPMDGCELGAARPCGGPLVLRWQWTGAVPQVELAYDVTTTLVSYGGQLGSRVETSFGTPVVIPPGARAIEAKRAGTVGLDRYGGGASFDLVLSGAPAAPAPEAVEVPGVLLVTVSALGAGGLPSPGAKAEIRVADRPGVWTGTYPGSLDLAVDGVPKTFAVPVFANCKPGVACRVPVDLFASAPPGADLSGVTLTYSLDARATAFAGSSLGPDASLSLTPSGSAQP